MNPNTYLCPILGVYKLKLHKSSQVPPIIFILMRNVLNLDPEDLNPDDKVYCFDLKGSLHGRRTLENPIEIMNHEENYEFHKNLVLKDIDFFQSFRKLDITADQSEKIMSQIEEDASFLSHNNFMDYSLLLYIVIKPYEEIKSILPSGLYSEKQINRFKSIDFKSPRKKKQEEDDSNQQNFPQNKDTLNVFPTLRDGKRFERAMKNSPNEEKPKAVHTIVRKFSDVESHEEVQTLLALNKSSNKVGRSTLYMSEGLSKQKGSKFTRFTSINRENPVLVLKERKHKKMRIYHITNINDISNMKSIEQEEKRRVTQLQIQQSKYNSIAEGKSGDEDQNSDSQDSQNFDEYFNQENNVFGSEVNNLKNITSRPSAAFFGRESVMSCSGGGIGRSSILNFNTGIK